MATDQSPLRVVHAVCSHDCPDSCAVLVSVDGEGRATKVAGDPAHPVTRGFLCAKVARYLDRVYSPDRLLYPMRRRAGMGKSALAAGAEAAAFERISWDEALATIAARLGAIAREHGPESVLPYSYAGTIGTLGYGSMDRRFFHRLGASQLDRTICATAGGDAFVSVYGRKLGTDSEQFHRAWLIVAWGANIHGNAVHLWPEIEEARRAGARLIVIDPYATRTAKLADWHIAIHPGTDVALALGMMHVIFAERREDRGYIDRWTVGARELEERTREYTPERVAAWTGMTADEIRALAREYATTRPAVIRMNYGIQRAENGGTAARAVAMLPLITGSWQQRGGGLLLSTSGAFPFASAKLQMPDLMQRSPLGRAARTINMNELGWALTELGQETGSRQQEAAEAGVRARDAGSSASLRNDDEGGGADGGREAGGGPEADVPVKAMFVYNCNAAAVAPDSQRVLAGLRRPDLFTVVHEQFFTDTTDYADIVLPATTFLEHKELMGAYGHYMVQLSEPAITPLGEARPNTWLFAELGRRMGFAEPAFSADDDELIEQALDSGHPWFAGITRERLEQEKQLPLAIPRTAAGDVLPFSDASWFRTEHGRAELLPVPVFVPPQESASSPAKDTRFPLEFLPRKADNYMNTTFANLPAHQQMERRSEGVLDMHATDAAARGIGNGDAVEIWNDRGRITLHARVGSNGDARVAPGVVAARLDWHKLSPGGVNVNALTSQRLTDIGGGATFYSTLVEVRKAAE